MRHFNNPEERHIYFQTKAKYRVKLFRFIIDLFLVCSIILLTLCLLTILGDNIIWYTIIPLVIIEVSSLILLIILEYKSDKEGEMAIERWSITGGNNEKKN